MQTTTQCPYQRRPGAPFSHGALHARGALPYLSRMPLTPPEFVSEIRRRGAGRVRSVTFRDNRSTLWSLTKGGTVLNVHSAYREAPADLLDAFATLAREGGARSETSRRAAQHIREWPPVVAAMKMARLRFARDGRRRGRSGSCCATDAQRSYLRALFRYFNQTRFGGCLPADIPVRLSRRMKSALGHMRPGEDPESGRFVAEIALNVDLLLPGNGPERIDTLLHEMAHAADYLETGHRGHGPSWRSWAARAGCRPSTLYDRPVRFRAHRTETVSRVPPLPAPLRTTRSCSVRHAGQSHPNAPAVSSA